MREIKFRAWDNKKNIFVPQGEIIFSDYGDTKITVNPNCVEYIGDSCHDYTPTERFKLSQYTGLKDKNGKEIYEYMEIDNLFEVSFLNYCYVLTNISNGDIITLSDYIKEHNGKIEVTREYTKI